MKHSRRRAVLVAASALLLGVSIGVAAIALGVHVTRVVSTSMSPEIHRGEWIVTRDLSEDDRHALRRRDIVLFRFPLGTAGRAVKRVVAIAGDRITIRERSVTVDGHVIPILGAPSQGAARSRAETVPEGHVFLLGDNAEVSIDSRSFGPVPETEVVGRVLFVIAKRTLVFLGLAAVSALIACCLLVARQRRRGESRRSRATRSGRCID